MTLWLLTNGAICRFSDWREYVEKYIGEDVALLTQCLLGDEKDDEELPWTKPPHIKRCMRAEFRVNYFMNGASHLYNYRVTSYMMARKVEQASVYEGTVRVRTLDDNARYEDDLRNWDEERLPFNYPVYTRILPAKKMKAVQYAWTSLQCAWDCGQVNPDPTDEAVRIIITL